MRCKPYLKQKEATLLERTEAGQMLNENNDYFKATKYIFDKNNSLVKVSQKTGIAVSRLSAYRANPKLLKTAHWDRVHCLAQLYDQTQAEAKGRRF